jgi:ribosomal protein S18 acetylase RimI-like enzyme
MDDLDRFFACEAHRHALLSTRAQPFEGGVAYFDDDYPERYISNFLLGVRDDPALTGDRLASLADDILGGAGLPHRRVTVLHEGGDRLAPAFRGRGYEVGRIAAMVLRRHPDRPAALSAEERSFDEARPLTEEIYRRELPQAPETAARFVEQHAAWDRILGTRRFVARFDGELAGQCELYVDGTDAQIEYVDTLEEHRGRGVARAVVLAAVEAARRAGADRVFIAADEDDWPKSLYQRLGFDPIGRAWEFFRYPHPHE